MSMTQVASFKSLNPKRIYISNIAKHTPLPSITEEFSQYGTIDEVSLGDDSVVSILYLDEKSAEDAIGERNLCTFRGRIVMVRYEPPHPRGEAVNGSMTRIILKNLPVDLKHQSFLDLVSRCAKPTDSNLVKDLDGINRGHAFAGYATEEEAENTIAGLKGSLVGVNTITAQFSDYDYNTDDITDQSVS